MHTSLGFEKGKNCSDGGKRNGSIDDLHEFPFHTHCIFVLLSFRNRNCCFFSFSAFVPCTNSCFKAWKNQQSIYCIRINTEKAKRNPLRAHFLRKDLNSALNFKECETKKSFFPFKTLEGFYLNREIHSVDTQVTIFVLLMLKSFSVDFFRVKNRSETPWSGDFPSHFRRQIELSFPKINKHSSTSILN